MDQPITDYLAFLQQARDIMIDLTGLKERQNQLSGQEKQTEKSLETKKKEMSAVIQQTVKKRSQEIIDSYDSELSKGQERLKKSRVKREKAKNKGVKERIEEETQELHGSNKELKMQIKTLFHQNRVPSFCNTSLYYTVYFPRYFSDFIRLIVMVLIFFGAVPYGVYLLLPVQKALYLAGISLAAVLVFGGCYVLIGNRTKISHLTVLKNGELIRNQIHSNKKKIKVIVKSIRRDKDDAVYNLQKYDDEIAQTEQELTLIGTRKREALATFENVTKTILTDEIIYNYQPRIDELTEELQVITRELAEVNVDAKEKALHVADHFEPYLGKEFLNIKKLDELIQIMNENQFTTLNEAVEHYKKTTDVR